MAGEEFVIGLFAAISTLVWVELEIRSLDKTKKQLVNLKQISTYFLTSLTFFGITALAYYATIQPATTLYQNSDLTFIEASAFAIGLFTLIAGAWGLHRTGMGGEGEVSIPSITITVAVGLWVLFVTVGLVRSIGAFNNYSVEGKVWIGLLCLSYPAAVLAVTRWAEKRLFRWLSIGLFLLPWVYITVVVFLATMGLLS